MRLTYTATDPQLTAGLDDRVLTGLALPYGQPGNTSSGRVTVDAGAVTIPTDLRRVKLFTEHGRTVPVGYATVADDTPDRLDMSFHVAATPTGDTALLEASEGVRDALSVELDNIVIRSGHVTAGDLVAVALTSIPAYPNARLITAADTPTEGDSTVPDISGSFTGQLDGQFTEPASEPASTEPASAAADVRASAPRAMTAARPPASLSAVAARAGAAIQLDDPQALRAALVDIKWSDGPGAAAAPPQLVELWEGVGYTRKFVPNTTYSNNLTSLKIGGFRMNPKPGVDDYAGDKAAIPSFPAKFVFEDHPVQRLAGGNDVDRAYTDLAVPGFWEAYWAAMAESYAIQSDEYVLTQMLDQGTTVAAAAASAWAAVVAGLVTIAATGGTPKVAIAANLVDSIASTSSSDVPFMLQSMFGNVNDLIGVAGGDQLADNTVLVWAKEAVLTKELGSTPIRVQAINLPNGGIDAAVFGYIGSFVSKPEAVLAYTVTEPAPEVVQ